MLFMQNKVWKYDATDKDRRPTTDDDDNDEIHA